MAEELGAIIIVYNRTRGFLIGNESVEFNPGLYTVPLTHDAEWITFRVLIEYVTEKLGLNIESEKTRITTNFNNDSNVRRDMNGLNQMTANVFLDKPLNFYTEINPGLTPWYLIRQFIYNSNFLGEDRHIVRDKESNSISFRQRGGSWGFPKGRSKPIDGGILTRTIQREFEEEIFYNINNFPNINIKWLNQQIIGNNGIYNFFSNSEQQIIINHYAHFFIKVDDDVAANILAKYNQNRYNSELFNLQFTKVLPVGMRLNLKSMIALELFLIKNGNHLILENASTILNSWSAIYEHDGPRVTVIGRLQEYGGVNELNPPPPIAGSKRYREERKYLKYKAKYLALKKLLNL
jgi:hypothetical protein